MAASCSTFLKFSLASLCDFGTSLLKCILWDLYTWKNVGFIACGSRFVEFVSRQKQRIHGQFPIPVALPLTCLQRIFRHLYIEKRNLVLAKSARQIYSNDHACWPTRFSKPIISVLFSNQLSLTKSIYCKPLKIFQVAVILLQSRCCILDIIYLLSISPLLPFTFTYRL
jgi:hypothetical protein